MPSPRAKRSRVAILVVAYNAASTLRNVLERIPREVWQRVEEVLVFDDSSQDDTYLVGLGFKALHGVDKLTVLRNEKNLGYGGNQIRGYQYAIERGYDVVALLHGDGQYAPELLTELLSPITAGTADAVFGSRMMPPSQARRGGMPLYKFIGNRILTAFENAALGTALSEFHSGYRIYACDALQRVPFERNSHDFHFDTQIIIQFHAAGLRIVELPIPTYYGSEISHVNGLSYAKNVARSVLEYKLHELGLRHQQEYEVRPVYTLKQARLSSHTQLLQLVGSTPCEILDVGCGSGELSRILEEAGHRVTAIDVEEPSLPLSEFIKADLADGLQALSGRRFDVILLADVLEHQAEPPVTLQRAKALLRDDGCMLVSLPNAVHWSVRSQVLLGRFDYTNKGILDRGHLRFFTAASAQRMFERAGLQVEERRTTPVPWENVVPRGLLSSALERVDHGLTQLSANLFAYQHVFRLRKRT